MTTTIGTAITTVLDARFETAVIASLAAGKVTGPLVDFGLDLLDTDHPRWTYQVVDVETAL